jgi:mono/diheme cytochrome c family protein
MRNALSASVRATCAAVLFTLALAARADAIPVFANGQGISCEVCHTTFPGMTPYGMMTMMTNFQNLDYKKQEQAFPVALRAQILSYFGNSQHPQNTYVNTLSILAGGFLGKNFTWYTEQPIVDSGFPGTTEQMWLSWNGLFHGTNSIQIGKAHTWFPFMPAHGWTLGDYLLATQNSGQNTFEPNNSRWGVTFNGMTNEFMYSLSYTTSVDPIQHAFDFNKADGNRVLDANVSYGGMTQPWTIGLVGIRGTSPLDLNNGDFANTDLFSREGVYYSYQTSKWFLQTMWYHGFDAQPDIGVNGAPFNGAMLELQRSLTQRDFILARYDVASSDTLNRQYILDYAHNFVPNVKVTAEVGMSPQSRPEFGLAFDIAGPWELGKRYLADGQVVSVAESAPPPIRHMTGASGGAAPSASSGNANSGAKLVQSSGCEGCHGAALRGGSIGPSLFGIEHRLSSAQIASKIGDPKPPMPNFGFTSAQIADIVAYLSGLDGGSGGAPAVSFDPNPPDSSTTITVTFTGTPPATVTAATVMQMGSSSMRFAAIRLQPSPSDPHVFTGKLNFSMGGPWTVRVHYADKTLDVPLTVNG